MYYRRSVEAETFAEEIYHKFCQDLQEKQTRMILEMKDVNRQVVFAVLEKIRTSGNVEFTSMLEQWKATEVRKIRERIASVQKALET